MEVDVESVDEHDMPGDKDDDESKESMATAEVGGKVPCEYLQSRSQNIKIIKKLSAEFRDEFNMSGDPEQRKPASKMKEKGKKAQNKESVRQQSQRNKDRCVFSDHDKSFSHSMFPASYPLPSLRCSLLRTQLPLPLSSMKAFLPPLPVGRLPHQ